MFNWGSDSRRLKLIISFSKEKTITFLFEICSVFKLDARGQASDLGGLTLRMMIYISTWMMFSLTQTQGSSLPGFSQLFDCLDLFF